MVRLKKVVWNDESTRDSWVVLQEATGELLGSVQVEAPAQGAGNLRNYQVFAEWLGLQACSGTLDAAEVTDAMVLEIWVRHQPRA